MLKQYVPHYGIDFPFHATGEVVLASIGNYLEAGDKCRPKARPAIILASGSPQHVIAGLTTRARCLSTGAERVEVPDVEDLGLDSARRSYLWSPHVSRACRLDVDRHLGWITLDTVEFLRRAMHLPRWIYTGLLRAAADAHRTTRRPR